MAEEQSREDIDRDYHAFFELLGHFVTRYQSVEDYLVEIFSAALGDNDSRNRAIFSAVRGIDSKLKLIDAALIGRAKASQQQWTALRGVITKAHDTRGHLAHCKPFTTGQITIVANPGGSPTEVESQGQWMEARKATSAGERVWKVEDLRVELDRISRLFSAQIAFVHILSGREAPENLLNALSDVAG